jgi:hypothetical protein
MLLDTRGTHSTPPPPGSCSGCVIGYHAGVDLTWPTEHQLTWQSVPQYLIHQLKLRRVRVCAGPCLPAAHLSSACFSALRGHVLGAASSHRQGTVRHAQHISCSSPQSVRRAAHAQTHNYVTKTARSDPEAARVPPSPTKTTHTHPSLVSRVRPLWTACGSPFSCTFALLGSTRVSVMQPSRVMTIKQ